MKKEFWKLLITIVSLIYFSFQSAAQIIRHSYHFYNNLSASAPDCGPDLVQSQAGGNCSPVAQPGSFISDAITYCGLTRTVYHNNIHWGLEYPNTVGTITTTYTIHMYVKTTNWGGFNPWTRIIDFSNGLSDNGIYYKQHTASPDRCIDFWPNGIVGPCPYFNNSTYYLLTITRDGATGMMNVYVNNILFGSYNDASGTYTGTAGTPIYIYRDDQSIVPCEAGEANFAYLAFTNQYSSQTMVDSVYNLICSIANPVATSAFSMTPNPVCTLNNVTVTYNGNITSPGTGYTFNWNWDGGTIISGSGIGPYIINWSIPGIKNVTLTVINNTCGNQNSNTQQIPIGLNSVSTINQSICEGQSFLGYSTSGVYKDTLLATNGCDTIRTLNLTVMPKPKPDLGADKELCEDDSLVLNPGSFSSYLWQDGSSFDYFIVKQPGIYSVLVTNNCGVANDAITIMNRSCDIYFPSAFTPNNDGKNDLFKVLNAFNLQEYDLTVYNRWGQKIFKTKNYADGWNGALNGKLQNAGIYIWMCSLKKNNIRRHMKGTVVLIR